MRPVGSWLERFRRPAAVPAAASDDLAAELAPVFAALGAIEAEAARLRDDAAREAARRRAAAAAEAERILARARLRAEAERARAEAQRRAEAVAAAQEIEAAALAEAGRIRERGRERLPALVDEVVASLTDGTQ